MKLQRRVLRVSGDDRAKFLGDLLTIQVSDAMPLRYGALLSPQGKILTDLFVVGREGALDMDLPNSEYNAIKARLLMYRLRAKVDFLDLDTGVYQTAGEGDPRGAVGRRVYEPSLEWSGDEYLNARIEACVPEFGVDFHANEAYPREWRFDEMQGIDYKKGCFVGQEIAARMRHKSELLKSVMRVESPRPLQFGETVMSAGKEVGQILSAQGTQALAFIKLKSLDAQDLWAGDAPLSLK